MKRQTLVNGLIAITAVSVATGCVDDKYDLSDIDTTSRFTVNDLTVPVNLSEIRLENVVDLDDNDLIEKEIIDGQERYAIVQGGEIAPTEFNIGSVHVDAPHIEGTNIHVGLSGLPNVTPGTYIPIPVDLDINLFENSQPTLVDYSFEMHNVHEALKKLNDVKTVNPIEVKVVLSVPSELLGANNTISFRDLKLQLPWGMMVVPNSGYTYTSDGEKGILTVPELAVGSDGKAVLTLQATGLELGSKGVVENGNLGIAGQVGVLEGKLHLSVQGITLPSSLDISTSYSVSSFDLKSFGGDIDYNMDAIHIDPISLNDLPDFLDSPETNIVIANPQILVSIKNPVGKYGLVGKGMISLVSNFKTDSKDYNSDTFQLVGDESKLAFCTGADGYVTVPFNGLRDVLTSGQEGSGLPTSIEVNINDINFAGTVQDFPLGDLGSAEGDYSFKAPLGFGYGSVVVYETTQDGWGGDDLDDVNINKIHLRATCTTNLPVSIHLTIIPVDKNGNEIAIKEDNRYFDVPAMAQNEPVILNIESVNGPIKNFDGVKFIATVRQEGDNTEAIGPDLNIVLKDLRVTVDGYYETDF